MHQQNMGGKSLMMNHNTYNKNLQGTWYSLTHSRFCKNFLSKLTLSDRESLNHIVNSIQIY